MKIIEKEFNALTGEETITERDETAQEVAERKSAEAKAITDQAEAEARATQKAALLERLGITEAEAKLLLG
jgi:chorismate mutase